MSNKILDKHLSDAILNRKYINNLLNTKIFLSYHNQNSSETALVFKTTLMPEIHIRVLKYQPDQLGVSIQVFFRCVDYNPLRTFGSIWSN